LQAGVANVIAASSGLTADGGATFNLASFDNTVGSLGGSGAVTLGSGTLTTGSSQSTTWSGDISGTGGLIKTGSTIFTLASGQSYTGPTTVQQGTLQAGATNVITASSGVTIDSGATFDINSFDNTIGSLSGNGAVTLGTGTLTTGSGQSTTWAGDISGGGGLVKTGETIFTLASGQSFTGPTTVQQGTLQAGAADVIATSTGLTVNNGSIFNMGFFDQSIGGDVINNGLISFGAIGNEFTASGDLSGNGMFFMETDVAAGIGDHITVTGTSADSHLLRIINIGNTPTSTQVLEVVDTTDGLAPFAAVGGTVDVGLYAYEVMRGDALGLDPTNWYLGNTQKPSEGARAILNTAAGLTSLWFTQMDNLHRRMGQQRLVDPGALANDVWLRGYSRKIEVDDSVSGRPFDEHINGIDVGIDTVVNTDDVDTWIAGAFAGYGRAERDFNDIGSYGESRTPYGGLYGTWFDRVGYYVDATFKIQYFDNTFDAVDGSGNRHRGEYNRLGIGGGVEAGRRFYFDEGWSIQPQAQIHYVYLNADEHTTDRNTHVKLEGNSILQARAGLEGGKEMADASGGIWYPYGRISVIEQFSNGNKLTAETLSFTPELTGTSFEYGVGLIYQMDDRRQGYLAFTTGIGDHYDTPQAFNFGLRYEF